MDIVTRDALRTAVIEKLLADFPKAQKVQGGVAFISETMDEETGLYFPVEIKVAVKNTQATARSEAYDFDKAVADFAAKPGRRQADPAKADEYVAKAVAAYDACTGINAEYEFGYIGKGIMYYNIAIELYKYYF